MEKDKTTTKTKGAAKAPSASSARTKVKKAASVGAAAAKDFAAKSIGARVAEAKSTTPHSRPNWEKRIVAHLDIKHSLAKPGYNRWLVPPAALAIHLSIGMAYGFSVFWLPLTNILGSKAAACPNLLVSLFSVNCQWRLEDVLWVYALFFLFLGGAAAVRGSWLERVGPRHAGVEAAFCWGGGLILGGVGVYFHQLWLMCLGAGVLGGIGLGIGYISPVSLLIKWFPDRRGVAVGMAIMGFGGGAMIGSPLASQMMTRWLGTPETPAVWQSFMVLGAIYFVYMFVAALNYRLPPPQWEPEGWTKPKKNHDLVTEHSVNVKEAHKTPQFWMLWFMLFFNVSAGIGILGIASNIFQKVFGGKLIGFPDLNYADFTDEQKANAAAVGAAFVGVLAIGNIIGRIFWASLSDWIGRKRVYYLFFVIGLLLYSFTPFFMSLGIPFLFVVGMFVIISMYGGGFASLPAYIADLFGTTFVGAIHGRLLTAWSAAGVVGTFVIPYVLKSRVEMGLDLKIAYAFTFYILAGFLLIGAGLNFLIRKVEERHFMSSQEVADHYERLQLAGRERTKSMGIGVGTLLDYKVVIAWSLVIVPMVWGAWFTILKLAPLLK